MKIICVWFFVTFYLQGPTIEIHTCKLLIILDYMNSDIPESILLKVISVTFESVIEAFRIRDSILLRQIIQFFLDVGKQNSLEDLLQKQRYDRQLATLLEVSRQNDRFCFFIIVY